MPAAWVQNVSRNQALSGKDGWNYRVWDFLDSSQIILKAIMQYCNLTEFSFNIEDENYDSLAIHIYKNFLCLPGVVQSDYVRFAVIYYHGGIYADASDVTFYQSIERFIQTLPTTSKCHFHVERYGSDFSIGNASLGARPESATIWGFLANLFRKLETPFESLQLKTQEHVYEFAGPRALTDYVCKITDLDLKEATNQLEIDHLYHGYNIDHGKEEIISLCSPESLIGVDVPPSRAIFGVHRLEGSWKHDIPSEFELRGRRNTVKVGA